jgi:hypothetical protein
MVFTTSKAICLSNGSRRLIYTASLVWLVLLSCSKDERLPFATIPEIELIGVSHDTIIEFQDVLTLSIGYFDGDGDLGFEEPDRYALFVRDVRLEDFDGFFIGPVSPPDTTIAIQGNLDIEFPSLFVFGNSNAETTHFEIKMIDRAGNESNVLSTEDVVIVKP